MPVLLGIVATMAFFILISTMFLQIIYGKCNS